MVVYCWTVQGEQIQPACAIGVLQVGREHELEDVVDRDLGFDVLEFWWLLWNGQQEDVPFLIGCLGIIASPKSIPNCIFTVLAPEPDNLGFFLLLRLRIDFLWARQWLFGLSSLRILVSNEVLPPDDGAVQLDFLLGLLAPDGVGLVDQQQDDRLGRHHVLLDLSEEVLVPVRVKQIQYFFFAQDLAFLVKDLEVLLIEHLVDLGDFGLLERNVRLYDCHRIRDRYQFRLHF